MYRCVCTYVQYINFFSSTFQSWFENVYHVGCVHGLGAGGLAVRSPMEPEVHHAHTILFAVEFQSEIACSNAYLANYTCIFRLTFLSICS